VRNRLKIVSAVTNARAVLDVVNEHGSLHEYLWTFVDGRPIINERRTMKDLPAKTAESTAMSKALLKRGFKFVGPTICYAFMQAVGMVNDHVVDCFRYAPLARSR
jgi:DNA-3-methyladenine glycosylase I